MRYTIPVKKMRKALQHSNGSKMAYIVACSAQRAKLALCTYPNSEYKRAWDILETVRDNFPFVATQAYIDTNNACANANHGKPNTNYVKD